MRSTFNDAVVDEFRSVSNFVTDFRLLGLLTFCMGDSHISTIIVDDWCAMIGDTLWMEYYGIEF